MVAATIPGSIPRSVCGGGETWKPCHGAASDQRSTERRKPLVRLRHRTGPLQSLGFDHETAEAISELHAANLM